MIAWPRWLDRRAAPEADRWLVLDVESSGLDPHHDRLLAVAALAVRPAGPRLLLSPGDSFEVVLRQPEPEHAPDKGNILVHGIGVDAQRRGQAPALALQAFQDFAAHAPLIGFHAAFDRALIDRHCQAHLGHRPRHDWLDLAELAPALCPTVKARALDDWLAHFGISVAVRHQAAADTWATAELLQRLWPLALAQGAPATFRALAGLAASRRWLGP